MEPLEDSIIATLRYEEDIRTSLCSTIRDLHVTLQEIRNEAVNDEFIKETKTKIVGKDKHISDSFSFCYIMKE